jgi:diaminohydroxyphosphoribosylaminopyrimidine deaminase/5-amino-6-(5-phosphoribosylamino)uracil reductase
VVRGYEEADIGFMRRALELAENGLGLAAPNPMVGAVVVSGGRVVGEGWHEGPGAPHAEMIALREAGDRARGATLYVTLEPCSHHGRTGPCAPAVAESGVGRVVAAIRDPNPQVDGRGFDLLRRAGLQVDVGACRSEGEELILGFATHVRTGRPHVTLKMAASLDGKIAARDGSSTWITGEGARRDAHRLRARSGAVIVGAGTAISDRPRLTVRLEGYRGRQPLRVVADSSGRTPADGPLFDGTAPTLIATSRRVPDEVRRAWVEGGAAVVAVGDEAVGLADLLDHLGKEGIQEALIEGGQTLAWSAVEEGVVDRVVLYLAPKLIGGESAPGILGGKGFGTLADAPAVDLRSVEMVGPDVKVVGDVHRDR